MGCCMQSYSKLVQALIGTGLIVGMNSAFAGLWHDAEMNNALQPDPDSHYVTKGNAWLNGHTYFQENTLVSIGGSFTSVTLRPSRLVKTLISTH